MKRVLAIVTVLALLLPFAATYSVLQWQKWSVKREVKHQFMRGLSNEELVRFSFHKEEVEQLKWEHSREFEYRERMYDVVRSFSSNDSVVYFCWPDHKESRLNQKLEQLLAEKHHSDEATGSEESLVKFPQFEYEKASFSILGALGGISSVPEMARRYFLAEGYLGRIIHPPERMF